MTNKWKRRRLCRGGCCVVAYNVWYMRRQWSGNTVTYLHAYLALPVPQGRKLLPRSYHLLAQVHFACLKKKMTACACLPKDNNGLHMLGQLSCCVMCERAGCVYCFAVLPPRGLSLMGHLQAAYQPPWSWGTATSRARGCTARCTMALPELRVSAIAWRRQWCARELSPPTRCTRC